MYRFFPGRGKKTKENWVTEGNRENSKAKNALLLLLPFHLISYVLFWFSRGKCAVYRKLNTSYLILTHDIMYCVKLSFPGVKIG